MSLQEKTTHGRSCNKSMQVVHGREGGCHLTMRKRVVVILKWKRPTCLVAMHAGCQSESLFFDFSEAWQARESSVTTAPSPCLLLTHSFLTFLPSLNSCFFCSPSHHLSSSSGVPILVFFFSLDFPTHSLLCLSFSLFQSHY